MISHFLCFSSLTLNTKILRQFKNITYMLAQSINIDKYLAIDFEVGQFCIHVIYSYSIVYITYSCRSFLRQPDEMFNKNK